MGGEYREYFYWRGEPILDIEAWARERGEQIVHYRHTRRTVYGHEINEGDMPESYWTHLLIGPYESYEELSRRNPLGPAVERDSKLIL